MIKTTYRIALAAIFCVGLGCSNDSDNSGGGGGASDQEVLATCQSYCDKALVCDSDVDADDCVTKCQDRLGECMADEQHQTLDDLDVCAAKACDKFNTCTIGAGLQCVFGL